MIDDTSSMVCPAEPHDEASINFYETLQPLLKNQDNENSFMDLITVTLLVAPELVTLDNILFIIEDQDCRHRNIGYVGGRKLIQYELKHMTSFDNDQHISKYYLSKLNPRTLYNDESSNESDLSQVDYSDSNSDWYDDRSVDTDLIGNFYAILHTYYLCYQLREYVSSFRKIMHHFQEKMYELK